MMIPIHRIPRDGDFTFTQIIDAEGPHPRVGTALGHLFDHTQNDDSLTVALDWAAQLRDETGRDWGECIETAMVMYFG